jgi:hypothetical protein
MNTKGRDKGPCLFVAAKHVAEKQGLNDFRLCVRVGSLSSWAPAAAHAHIHSITFVRYFPRNTKGNCFLMPYTQRARDRERDNSKESQIFLSPRFCRSAEDDDWCLQRESSVLCRALPSFFAEWIGASANGKAELAMVIEVHACALSLQSKLHSAHAVSMFVCLSPPLPAESSVCLRRRHGFEQCGCKLNAARTDTRQETFTEFKKCLKSSKQDNCNSKLYSYTLIC